MNEVSIEEGDFKIKVKKTGAIEQVTYTQPVAPPTAPMPVAQPVAPTPAAASPEPASKGDTMKSPIVELFIRQPHQNLIHFKSWRCS